jgi:hypothetical protein
MTVGIPKNQEMLHRRTHLTHLGQILRSAFMKPPFTVRMAGVQFGPQYISDPTSPDPAAGVAPSLTTPVATRTGQGGAGLLSGGYPVISYGGERTVV